VFVTVVILIYLFIVCFILALVIRLYWKRWCCVQKKNKPVKKHISSFCMCVDCRKYLIKSEQLKAQGRWTLDRYCLYLFLTVLLCMWLLSYEASPVMFIWHVYLLLCLYSVW